MIANSVAVIIERIVMPITTSISVKAERRLWLGGLVNIDVEGVFLRYSVE